MIISVDTVKDTPEALKAAAKLILEMAGESAPQAASAVRDVPRRIVPDLPSSKSLRVEEVETEADGAEELGLEVYDDTTPEPKAVTIARAETRTEQKRVEQKAPEKPMPKLPGNVQVY